MNSEALRKHLAIKARGWELIGDIYWGDGVAQSYESSWKPDENIEQAIDCLDMFVNFEIWKRKPPDKVTKITKYQCDIWDDKAWNAIRLGQGNSDTSMSEAVSIASAKATGWKE